MAHLRLGLTRIIAAMTALFFTWETAAAYSFPAFDLVPEAYAQVESHSSQRHSKTVFLLLNAHASSDAQRNIAETLNYLHAQGVDLIGLEGADDTVDGKPFRNFPFKDSLACATWQMVKEGVFTGAEYFYITAEKLPQFYGLEDRDLYLQNRQAFTETVRSAETLQPTLADLRDAIGALKKKIYSKRLYDFDRMIFLHREGDLSFMDYLEGLVRGAKEAKIALPDYSNVYALAKGIEKERKASKEEREKNLERIRKELNPQELFDEFETMTEQIYERLIKSEKERTVVEFASQFEMLAKLLTIELTQKEWSKLDPFEQTKTARPSHPQPSGLTPYRLKRFSREGSKRIPHTDVKSILAFIRQELNGRAPQISASEVDQLHEALASAVEFYELAEKRNEIFTKKIIRAMEKSQKDVSIVVVGGFHEKGLKEALEAEGISTVVISPKINESASDIPYVDRMVGKPTHLEAITSQLISAIDLGQKISTITPIDVRKQAAVGLFLLSAAYELKSAGSIQVRDVIQTLNRAAKDAVPGVRLNLGSPVWSDTPNLGFQMRIAVDGKDVMLSVKENNAGSLEIDLTPVTVRKPAQDNEIVTKSIAPAILHLLSGPASLAGLRAASARTVRSEARMRDERTQEKGPRPEMKDTVVTPRGDISILTNFTPIDLDSNYRSQEGRIEAKVLYPPSTTQGHSSQLDEIILERYGTLSEAERLHAQLVSEVTEHPLDFPSRIKSAYGRARQFVVRARRTGTQVTAAGWKTQELFALVDELVTAVLEEEQESSRVSLLLERLEAKVPDLAHWPSWSDAAWEGLGNLRYLSVLNRLYFEIRDRRRDVLIRFSQMILDHFTNQKSRGRLSTKTREDRLERFYPLIDEQVQRKLADTLPAERELVIQYPGAGDGSTLIGLVQNLSQRFPHIPIRIEASDIFVRYFLVEEGDDFAIFGSGGELLQIGIRGKLLTQEDHLEDATSRKRFESLRQGFQTQRRQEFTRLNPKFDTLLKHLPENISIRFEERDIESNPYGPGTADIVLLSNLHYYVAAPEKQVEYRVGTEVYGGIGAVLWRARLDGIRQLFEFIGRALRPGGVFLVLQNSLDGRTWAQDLYLRQKDRLVLDGRYSLGEAHGSGIFDAGSILNIARLEQMGYRDLETIPIEFPYRERSPEEQALLARLSQPAPVPYGNLKIIFSDHSHTLLTPGKPPDPRLVELLSELFEEGALLVIETGDVSVTVDELGIIPAIQPAHRQQILINSATGAVAFEFNSDGTLNREEPVFNLAEDVLSPRQFQNWKEIMQNTFARYELGTPEFTVGYGDYSRSVLVNKDDAQLSLGLALGLTMMDGGKARTMNQWLSGRGLPPMVKTGVAWDLRTSITVHLKNEFQKAGLGNLIAVNPVSLRMIDTTLKGITKMQGVHELIQRGVIRKKLTEIRDRLEKNMTPEEQMTFRKNMPEDFDARYAEVWGDSFARVGNRRNDFELAGSLPDVYGVSFGDRNVSDRDLPSNVVRFRGPEGPLGLRYYLEEKRKGRAELRAQVPQAEDERFKEAEQELQETRNQLARREKKKWDELAKGLEKRLDNFPKTLFGSEGILEVGEIEKISGEKIWHLKIEALKFLKDLALSIRKAADLSKRKSRTDDKRKALATTTYTNIVLLLEKAALSGEERLLELIKENERATYPSGELLLPAGLAREKLDQGRIHGSVRGDWVRQYQDLADAEMDKDYEKADERVISSIHDHLDEYEGKLQYETLPREYLVHLASQGNFNHVSAWLLRLAKRPDEGYKIYKNVISSILNDPEYDSSRVEEMVADAADFVNLVLLFEGEGEISIDETEPNVSELLKGVAARVIHVFIGLDGNDQVFSKEGEARHVLGGRDYALFSDVHSSAYGINALLHSVPHAKPIIVGDLVDRGHELFEILKTTKRVTLADHDLWALGAAFGDPWLVAMWLRSNYRDDNEEILRQLGIDLTPIEQLADAYEERHKNFDIKKFLKVQRRKIEKGEDLSKVEHPVQKIDGRYYFEYQGENYPFLPRTFNNIHELASGNLWLKIWLSDEWEKGKQGNWQEPAMILARAPESLLLLSGSAYTQDEKKLTEKLRLAPSLTFVELSTGEQAILENLVQRKWRLTKNERDVLVSLQLEFVNSQKMRDLAEYLLTYGKVYEIIGPSPLLAEIDRQLTERRMAHVSHPRALLLHTVPAVGDRGAPVDLWGNDVPLRGLPGLLESYQAQLEQLAVEWRKLISKHRVGAADLEKYFHDPSVQNHISFFRLLADGVYSPLYARAQKRGYHMYVDSREEPDNLAHHLFEHNFETAKTDKEKKEAQIDPSQQSVLEQTFGLSADDFERPQDGKLYLKKSANAKIIAKFAEVFGVDAIVGGHISVKSGRIKASGDAEGAQFFRIDPYFVEKGGAAAEIPTGLASALLFGGSGVHEIFLTSLPELFRTRSEVRTEGTGLEADKAEVLKHLRFADLLHYEVDGRKLEISLKDLKRSGRLLEEIHAILNALYSIEPVDQLRKYDDNDFAETISFYIVRVTEEDHEKINEEQEEIRRNGLTNAVVEKLVKAVSDRHKSSDSIAVREAEALITATPNIFLRAPEEPEDLMPRFNRDALDLLMQQPKPSVVFHRTQLGLGARAAQKEAEASEHFNLAEYAAAIKSENYKGIVESLFDGNHKDAQETLLKAARDTEKSFAELVLGIFGDQAYQKVSKMTFGAHGSRSPPNAQLEIYGEIGVLGGGTGTGVAAASYDPEGFEASFTQETNRLLTFITTIVPNTDDGGNSLELILALYKADFGIIPPLGDWANSMFKAFVSDDKFFKILDGRTRELKGESEYDKASIYERQIHNIIKGRGKFEDAVRGLLRETKEYITNPATRPEEISQSDVPELSKDFYFFAANLLALARIIDQKFLHPYKRNTKLEPIIKLAGASVRNLVLLAALVDSGALHKEEGENRGMKGAFPDEKDQQKAQQAVVNLMQATGIKEGVSILTSYEPATLFATYDEIVVLVRSPEKASEYDYIKLKQVEDGENGQDYIRVRTESGGMSGTDRVDMATGPQVFQTKYAAVEVSLVEDNGKKVPALAINGEQLRLIEDEDGNLMVKKIVWGKRKRTKEFDINDNGTGQPVGFAQRKRKKNKEAGIRLGGVEVFPRARTVVGQSNITETLNLSKIVAFGLIEGMVLEPRNLDSEGKPEPPRQLNPDRRLAANPVAVASLSRSQRFLQLGPGSFFTSLLPNLLVREIVDVFADRKDIERIFVVNDAYDNETTGLSVFDMIETVETIMGRDFHEHFDRIVIGTADPVTLKQWAWSNVYIIPSDYGEFLRQHEKAWDELDLAVSREFVLSEISRRGIKPPEGDDLAKVKWAIRNIPEIRQSLNEKLILIESLMDEKVEVEFRAAGEPSKMAKKARGPIKLSEKERQETEREKKVKIEKHSLVDVLLERDRKTGKDIKRAGYNEELMRRMLKRITEEKGLKKMNPDVFKGDIQGIGDRELKNEPVRHAAQAYGTLLKRRTHENSPTVVIAGDTRHNTPRIKDAFIRGLTRTGIHVIDLGTAPIAYLYWAQRYLRGVRGGVMISGGHRGPDNNGIKLFYDGIFLDPNDQNFGIPAVQRLMESAQFDEGKGALSRVDLYDDYKEYIQAYIGSDPSDERSATEHQKAWRTKVVEAPQSADIKPALREFAEQAVRARPLRGMKVVIDSSNGAVGNIPKRIFEELGAQVYLIYAEPDGNFPNHLPNPKDEDALYDLKNRVKELGADVGFVFSSDGHRVGVVSSEGEAVDPDVLLNIFARGVYEDYPKGSIGGERTNFVFEVKTSMALLDQLAKDGAIPELWKVGFSTLQNRTKERDAAFGGETHGVYTFRDASYADDGIFVAAKLLQLMKKAGGWWPMIERFNVPLFPGIPEIRIPVKVQDSNLNAVAVMERIVSDVVNKLSGSKHTSIVTDEEGRSIDRARIDWMELDTEGNRTGKREGWFLIRRSGRIREITVRGEGTTRQKFQEIFKAAFGLLKKHERYLDLHELERIYRQEMNSKESPTRAEMRSDEEKEQGLTDQEQRIVKTQPDKGVKKRLRRAISASKEEDKDKFQIAVRDILRQPRFQMTNDGFELLKKAAQRLGLDWSKLVKEGNEISAKEAAGVRQEPFKPTARTGNGMTTGVPDPEGVKLERQIEAILGIRGGTRRRPADNTAAFQRSVVILNDFIGAASSRFGASHVDDVGRFLVMIRPISWYLAKVGGSGNARDTALKRHHDQIVSLYSAVYDFISAWPDEYFTSDAIPYLADSISRLGGTLRFIGQYEEAIQLLDLFQERTGNQPARFIDFHLALAHSNLGTQYFKAREHAKSEEHHLASLRHLARALPRYGSADEKMTGALSTVVTTTLPVVTKAARRRTDLEIEQALHDYVEAVRQYMGRGGDVPAAYKSLISQSLSIIASHWWEKRDHRLTSEVSKLALEIDPDHAHAMFYLAFALAERGEISDVDQAESYLQRIEEIDPEIHTGRLRKSIKFRRRIEEKKEAAKVAVRQLVDQIKTFRQSEQQHSDEKDRLQKVITNLNLPDDLTRALYELLYSDPFNAEDADRILNRSETRARASERSWRPEAVFIIEDGGEEQDPELIQFYQDIVRQYWGLSDQAVTIVDTAEKAEQIVSGGRRFDFMLVDNDLQGTKQGYEILPLLRQTNPNAVIVFNSANHDARAHAKDLAEQGMVDEVLFTKLMPDNAHEFSWLLPAVTKRGKNRAKNVRSEVRELEEKNYLDLDIKNAADSRGTGGIFLTITSAGTKLRPAEIIARYPMLVKAGDHAEGPGVEPASLERESKVSTWSTYQSGKTLRFPVDHLTHPNSNDDKILSQEILANYSSPSRSEVRSHDASYQADWDALQAAWKSIAEAHTVYGDFYKFVPEQGFFSQLRRASSVFQEGGIALLQESDLRQALARFREFEATVSALLKNSQELINKDEEALIDYNPKAANATFAVLAYRIDRKILDDDTPRHFSFGTYSLKQLAQKRALSIDHEAISSPLPDVAGVVASLYPEVMEKKLVEIKGLLDRFLVKADAELSGRAEVRSNELISNMLVPVGVRSNEALTRDDGGAATQEARGRRRAREKVPSQDIRAIRHSHQSRNLDSMWDTRFESPGIAPRTTPLSERTSSSREDSPSLTSNISSLNGTTTSETVRSSLLRSSMSTVTSRAPNLSSIEMFSSLARGNRRINEGSVTLVEGTESVNRKQFDRGMDVRKAARRAEGRSAEVVVGRLVEMTEAIRREYDEKGDAKAVRLAKDWVKRLGIARLRLEEAENFVRSHYASPQFASTPSGRPFQSAFDFTQALMRNVLSLGEKGDPDVVNQARVLFELLKQGKAVLRGVVTFHSRYPLKQKKEKLSPHIRWLMRRDLPDVLDIEDMSFEYPWLEDDFISAMRQRNIVLVAEVDDTIVGYVIYQLRERGMEVVALAVHPDFRHRGIGAQMVRRLKDKLYFSGWRDYLRILIREKNLGAQLFAKTQGFQSEATHRNFYEDTNESAYDFRFRTRRGTGNERARRAEMREQQSTVISRQPSAVSGGTAADRSNATVGVSWNLSDTKTITIRLTEEEVERVTSLGTLNRTDLIRFELVRDERVEILETLFALVKENGNRFVLAVPNTDSERALRRTLDSYRVARGIELSGDAQVTARDFGTNGSLIARFINGSVGGHYFITGTHEAQSLALKVDGTFVVYDQMVGSRPMTIGLAEKIRLARAVLIDEDVFRAMQNFENILIPEAAAFQSYERDLVHAKQTSDRRLIAA